MAIVPEKLDLFRAHAAEYIAHETPQLVRVEPATYLSISGSGEPGGEEFQHKVSALYAVAYTIKMACKAAGLDFVVAKLEGLWWEDGTTDLYPTTARAQWHWQLLIRVPAYIGHREIEDATQTLEERGRGAGVRDVTLETLHEELCVQALHVGPYTTETDTIRKMKTIAEESHLELAGRHHEIYLSDPAHTAPERLRTILRHPVTVHHPENT